MNLVLMMMKTRVLKMIVMSHVESGAEDNDDISVDNGDGDCDRVINDDDDTSDSGDDDDNFGIDDAYLVLTITINGVDDNENGC